MKRLLLVLPVLIPFMTTHLPGGHDVLDYLPRLVEFHEGRRAGHVGVQQHG